MMTSTSAARTDDEKLLRDKTQLLTLNSDAAAFSQLRDLVARIKMVRTDKISSIYLQGIEKLLEYLAEHKAAAFPRALEILQIFCRDFESTLRLTALNEKRDLLMANVQQYTLLKQQIAEHDAETQRKAEEARKLAASPEVLTSTLSDDPLLREIQNLRFVMLEVDWEISDATLSKLRACLDSLRSLCKTDMIAIGFLRGLEELHQYTAIKKSKASPDAVILLQRFATSLEQVVVSAEMPEYTKKKRLLECVEDFQKLKAQIQDFEIVEPEDEVLADGDELAPAFSELASTEIDRAVIPENTSLATEVSNHVDDFFREEETAASALVFQPEVVTPEEMAPPAEVVLAEPNVPAATDVSAVAGPGVLSDDDDTDFGPVYHGGADDVMPPALDNALEEAVTFAGGDQEPTDEISSTLDMFFGADEPTPAVTEETPALEFNATDLLEPETTAEPEIIFGIPEEPLRVEETSELTFLPDEQGALFGSEEPTDRVALTSAQESTEISSALDSLFPDEAEPTALTSAMEPSADLVPVALELVAVEEPPSFIEEHFIEEPVEQEALSPVDMFTEPDAFLATDADPAHLELASDSGEFEELPTEVLISEVSSEPEDVLAFFAADTPTPAEAVPIEILEDADEAPSMRLSTTEDLFAVLEDSQVVSVASATSSFRSFMADLICLFADSSVTQTSAELQQAFVASKQSLASAEFSDELLAKDVLTTMRAYQEKASAAALPAASIEKLQKLNLTLKQATTLIDELLAE